MVSNTPKSKNAPTLHQDRYPQKDLFICDVADAVLKDLMPQMEHPFYALSKKPDTKVIRYEHGENWLEIVPSVKGRATIYDKDILIYAISQVFAAKNRGEAVSNRVRMNGSDCLQFIQRGQGGKDYKALIEALDRLDGTRIRTNIQRDGEEQWKGFGLINAGSVARKMGINGRLLWCEIELSDWIFEAIENNQALTLHKDYFRIASPIDRRLYELARKHCGRQPEWRPYVETLYKKSGSQGSLKEFRRKIKDRAEDEAFKLPDYSMDFDEDADQVTFKNREEWWKDNSNANANEFDLPPLPTMAYEDARRVAPRYDIHALEAEWRSWWYSSGKPRVDNPTAAFVGFCKRRSKERPLI